MSKRIALVLSGCGFLDGAEITEAVSCLIHLSRHGFEVSCFAPDALQPSVVNHATAKPDPSAPRNMMVEAARITRGRISPLASLRPDQFDALVLPGGFGAAKNLSNFASEGPGCSVLPDVERVIRAFHAAAKPMAFCCIAPAVAARVLGSRNQGPGVAVTIGNDPATAGAISAMGATHVNADVRSAHVDAQRRVVTTPAYMFDAPPHEVFDGIGAMVDALAAMLSARA